MESLTVRAARRVVVAVVGVTLLAIGFVLIFTPGPAVVAVWLGLGVLAAEFAWARRWLRKLKGAALSAARRVEGEDRDDGESEDRDDGESEPCDERRTD